MGSKADFLEDKILDHVLRNTAYTSPVTVYLSLHDTDPTDTGSQANEVKGNNYAREIITFDAPSAGVTQNTGLVQFDTPSGSWGTVSHWGIMDALTTGNMLYHSAFDQARAIESADDVEIPIGSIIVQED